MEIDHGPEPMQAPETGAGWELGGERLVRVLQATSCCSLGLAAWEEYPTLKMLMEMVMTK